MQKSRLPLFPSLHPALRIALSAAILTGVWVCTADIIFDHYVADHEVEGLAKLPYYIVEVVPTTFLVFYLLRRELARRERITRAHQASERRLANILDTDADAIIGMDKDQRIFLFNRGAERIFGYSAQEIRHRPIDELLPVPGTDSLQSGRQQVFLTPESSAEAPVPYEVTARRKDGTAFPAEVRASGLMQNGSLMYTVILQDISTRKTAEEALRKSHEILELRVRERTRELGTLLDISRHVASTLDLEQLLGLILNQLKIMIDYTGAAIFAPDGGKMRILASQGTLLENQDVGHRSSLEETPGFQLVLQRREPVVIDDLSVPLAQGGGTMAGPETRKDRGLSRSWMGVPMQVKEKVVGILQLNHTQAGYFMPAHTQLALAIANQAAIAVEHSRLYQEAQKVAALEERQRLARELHDSVSQALHGIALGTHAAAEMLERSPERVRETLDYVLSLAEAGVTEMRCLIFDLRPDSIEAEGLIAAFQRLAEATQARHEIFVKFEISPTEPDIDIRTKEALYRICQEAFRNMAKHSRAQTALLRFIIENSAAILEVSDDGIGFDTGGSFPGHFGLQTMKERAAQLGGSLTIESRPARGTRLTVRIPVEMNRNGTPPIPPAAVPATLKT